MENINYADTTFVFLATILVMLMTPALSLFYAGMVRRKNVLSTTMHSYAAIAVVSIQWLLFGYSFVFGGNSKFFGDLSYTLLNGVGFTPVDYAPTIPHQLFMMFQLAFAIITPALISGSIAERMKFPAFLAFILLWTTFVYDPIAHWIWGNGGWIRELGALDFAGGSVIHISSGVSALVAAIYLGKRRNHESVKPHNIPMTMIGAGLLLFGWFGFNAGSALAINDIALDAFITTNTAAAAAGISWMVCEWIIHKKPTALGFVSGIVAGLVSITPGAGFVSPLSALVIGFVGGIVCFYGVSVLKKKFDYDDALDAFGCHGIGGIWGGIATGIFATSSINPAIEGGLVDGSASLLLAEVISILAVLAYAGIGSFLLLKLISLVLPLRVSAEEEEIGLDYAVHGETAYGSISSGLQDSQKAGEQVGSYPSELSSALQNFKNRALAPGKRELAYAGASLEDLNKSVGVEYRAAEISSGDTSEPAKLTKVEIITNESKFEALKKALNAIGITGMTVSDVFGYGMQKGHTTYYRGVETEADLLPKIRVEVVVSTVPVHKVVDAARKALYSGHIGDGKIFIYDVENVIRVSTGDEGKKALEYPTE
ncbi:ammonium transporter [Trichococcus ilyis]|uniref:Ammonium transporter n=1 Tax=Trichococcus ilyis TaxID=640938 RepID=A0A143Z212_9LACT|nr:nitrogen regulatory protein pii [Trichococcus ilyis]SEJ43575.1 ammonium transporter [Trichococcus ilyis]